MIYRPKYTNEMISYNDLVKLSYSEGYERVTAMGMDSLDTENHSQVYIEYVTDVKKAAK